MSALSVRLEFVTQVRGCRRSRGGGLRVGGRGGPLVERPGDAKGEGACGVCRVVLYILFVYGRELCWTLIYSFIFCVLFSFFIFCCARFKFGGLPRTRNVEWKLTVSFES